MRKDSSRSLRFGSARRTRSAQSRSARRQFSLYHRGRRPPSVLRRALRLLVLLFVTFQVLSAFFVQSYAVSSEAMLPTLESGDRVLAVPLLYGARVPLIGYRLPGPTPPRRGELVLVEPPYYEPPMLAVRLFDPVVRFFTAQRFSLQRGEDTWRSPVVVKRVIGLPGDRVRFEDHRAQVIVGPDSPESQTAGASGARSEFERAARPYELFREDGVDSVGPIRGLTGAEAEFELGPDEYFVAGDNRPRSLDSRHWGVVSFERLKARITLRYFPFGRFEVL